MSPIHKFDYLIVGQGLAGSSLAIELLKRDKKIMVWDRPDENRSSSVAAGLFNPVTGRVMTKTWKADTLFPYLEKFYREAEQMLGTRFFYPIPVYRPFLSIEEQNDWMAKAAEHEWSEYIRQVYTRTQNDQVKDELGGLLLSRCGYVDVNVFMAAVRDFLKARDAYRSELLDESGLTFLSDGVSYGPCSAKKIVFCAGIHALEGRLHPGVPLRPLKGETLSLKTQIPLTQIYNRGVYVVPSGNLLHYKAGATYSVKDTTLGSTAWARQELTHRLDELLRVPYQITNQHWGMRPTSPDRRPMLGVLPASKNAIIFNGLGTKGVSLAPYFAKQLADWLEGGLPLEGEVNVGRFLPPGRRNDGSEK